MRERWKTISNIIVKSGNKFRLGAPLPRVVTHSIIKQTWKGHYSKYSRRVHSLNEQRSRPKTHREGSSAPPKAQKHVLTSIRLSRNCGSMVWGRNGRSADDDMIGRSSAYAWRREERWSCACSCCPCHANWVGEAAIPKQIAVSTVENKQADDEFR